MNAWGAALAVSFFVVGCRGGATIESRIGHTYTGTGDTQSEAVSLRGDYLVTWALAAPPSEECLVSLDLEDTTDRTNRETVALEVVNNGQPAKGSTHVYGLADARYFVDGGGTSCGGWVVQVAPQ
jgi:hypothetical protein